MAESLADGRTRRIEYANVRVELMDLRTWTGERGEFRLVLPPGERVLLFDSPGYPGLRVPIRVRAGETTRADVVFGPRRANLVHVRAPDAGLLRRLREARTIEVFRLDPRDNDRIPGEPKPPDRLLDYRIVGRAPLATWDWRRELVAMLLDSTTWRRGEFAIKRCYTRPDVGLRVHGPRGERTELAFCLECADLLFQLDGKRGRGGQFDPRLHALRRLFSRAFPGDLQLRRLAADSVGSRAQPLGERRAHP